jgi:hypothetical protein
LGIKAEDIPDLSEEFFGHECAATLPKRMIIMFIQHATIANIVAAVSQLESTPDTVVFLAVADKNKPDIPQLIKQLNQQDIRFIGGVFPGLVEGHTCHDEGVKIFVFPIVEPPLLVKNISHKSYKLPEWKMRRQQADIKNTAMIFIDGYSSNISGFFASVFDCLGGSVSYIGGGAGCFLKHQPCIFTPEGFFKDAAVLTLIRSKSFVGVGHGFNRLYGPIIATRTYENVIAELNWTNAFEVYSKIVESDSGLKVTMDNFPEFANDYLFALTRECSEDVIRTPIGVNTLGEMICFSEVPENTVLYIAKGEKKSILGAPRQIGKGYHALAAKDVKMAMVFDCMGRRLRLQEFITEELSIVDSELTAHIGCGLSGGILTFGEIASDGNGFLEYYNKTLVVGVFYG